MKNSQKCFGIFGFNLKCYIKVLILTKTLLDYYLNKQYIFHTEIYLLKWLYKPLHQAHLQKT